MTSTKTSAVKPKLPVQQLTILAVARFAEPLAYTSVFPYLPEMIRDFGVEQNKIASWAGVTSASFSIAQSICAIPWGKASDRFGRKPVLLYGLASTMVTFVVWGMSTSLPMAIIVRAIQGGGNGNVGIIRTMVAEMVPERELQPRAFSIMPLVWSLGSVVGPSFGGFFAQPATRYPNLFGHIQFFKDFPYALPNLILTVFFLISLACAYFFLKETLASKKQDRDWGLLVGKRLTRSLKRQRVAPSHRRESFVDGEATAPLIPVNVSSPSAKPQGSPGLGEVFTRQTTINLISYTFLAFHSIAFDQILPVFLNYPKLKNTPENTRLPFYFTGGFGLKSGQIGTIFTLYGIVCGIIQFVFYPSFVARFGIRNCYRFCSIVLPITYLLLPYTVLFESDAWRYTALSIIMFIKAGCIITAFPSTTILLTNSCSSLRVLGTLNGFATAFSGLGRAAGPFLSGIVFTWGLDHGYVVAAFALLAGVGFLGIIPAMLIEDGHGPSGTPEQSDGEDEDSGEETLIPSGMLIPDESAVEDDSDDEGQSAQSPLLRKKGGYGSKYGTGVAAK